MSYTTYILGYKKNAFTEEQIEENPMLHLFKDMIDYLMEYGEDDFNEGYYKYPLCNEYEYPPRHIAFADLSDKEIKELAGYVVMGWTVISKAVDSEDKDFQNLVDVLNNYNEFRLFWKVKSNEDTARFRY